MTVLRVLYLVAPLVVAGVVQAPVIKRDLLASLARPLDCGRTLGGRPIFGANKTWRGIVLMSIVSVLVVFVQARLDALPALHSLALVDYARTSPLLLGLALGLGYSLSELPNSFVKRRLGIPPGGVTRRSGVVQYAVDQADSALGVTVVLALVLGLPGRTLVAVFLVGLALHAAMDRLLFLFEVKRVESATC